MLPQPFRRLRYRIFYGLLLSRRYRLVTLGDQSIGLQWTICPDGLNATSIVYSAGVGGDISFERALAERFACRVILLDPSPTGIETMSRAENQIPQFTYLRMALGAKCGVLQLARPPSGGDSWFATQSAAGDMGVPAINIPSLMEKNGHDHIDLLKLDIEGCECEVIEDILKRQIGVSQLCVEFDYGHVPGARRTQAIRAMLKLVAGGYSLVHQDGRNHTFIRRRVR